MRKLILLAALAATIAPVAASADPHGGGDRHGDRDRGDRDRGDRHEFRRDRDDRDDFRRERRFDHRRHVGVGFQLRRQLFAPNMFVSDIDRFHLRHPGRFQRWVRYGDELLLVDIRTGRVIAVAPNRFF